MIRLYNDDNRVDNFFDSHRNGLNKVADIAMGASFTNPKSVPSNSTPREKLDCAKSAWFSNARLEFFMLFVMSFTAYCPSSSL